MIITRVIMSSHANRCSHLHQTWIMNTEGEIITPWLWGHGEVVWGEMKGNGCMTAPRRTQKCHESQERRHRATGEDIPSPQQRSKMSSPEASVILLQSLLAVLISLHMSRIKIEFVWNRGGWNCLDECLLIVCVWLALATFALTDSWQRWRVFVSYIIVSPAHLCSASWFNVQGLNSYCTKDRHFLFRSVFPLTFRSVCPAVQGDACLSLMAGTYERTLH